MKYTYLPSPIGELLIAGDHAGIRCIGFPGGRHVRQPEVDWTPDPAPFARARAQLEAYFTGDLTEFDLPLAPQTTPFQGRVLTALRRVPYGSTVSYGELARKVGNPKASRAVGMANGRNPIPIIIPCHRVIGANGALTGFGGGLEAKRFLLELERRVLVS
ncbi:methylated-DNA-[protein]-cysteine S-methyltransferase [Natronospira proteinivora]|uniref:Methylated-DNA--protein-cysteine methyltransferase n=1 Tax=Natronospira proteinivora TaxID=1807133 RepID=A0ABT1G7G3_9GAMM|nr:methylated-DNA--[protein]-cysteine S-methyltransferase [Natronospira proteinivora]MCP1727243.1 methylated-DNA-[protein]-cysteine S-methyltransferase [Natronospira proteinivora]